jgi:eukaryotic-like serine/threonine-protein kinase
MFVAPEDELRPGTVVGDRYRILDIAGRGGMGIVYRAEDTKLHRVVALKFLPPALVHNAESRERFLIEAQAAAALSHPNICTIYEIYDREERPFLEMEYVEGRSIRTLVHEGPLPVGEAVEIAIQVAEALGEAHAKGVVHRDVKSSNIMVTSKGQAKVMDFGLAKVQGESLHTREGTTLGTVAYMSPEQAQGQPTDQRTDIWSLGVVLYEMLSGRLPFTGERDTSILYAVVHAEPRPLKEAAPGVPAGVNAIVGRALKKEMSARYGTAGDLARDLRAWRESQKAAVVSPWRTLRRPRVAIALAACLLLLCAAGAWWVHRLSRIRWAREAAIPAIERMIWANELDFGNFTRAYNLAVEAGKYVPNDPAFRQALERCSKTISITTEPMGATVWAKGISTRNEPWRRLGVSPIDKIRLPVGSFWWRFQRQGYETVEALAPDFDLDPASTTFMNLVPRNIHRRLDQTGKIAPGMVRVTGTKTRAGQLADFFIDKYEVTNREYKEFVDKGGYREPKYWKQRFVQDGKMLSWDAAVAGFRDQSGRPGPATWQAGEYPKGQENYPVSGVSWYEAAAYAEFAGKTLPTLWHWQMAAGADRELLLGWLGQVSNFKNEGPAAAGTYPSMTAYGAYDQPGNVREWCWNETKIGRVVRGGAWDDAPYMLGNISQALAFDRSAKNGFRCASYLDAEKIPQSAFDAFEISGRDFRKEHPVPDAVFEIYKEQFAYDPKDLRAQIEWRNEDSPDWVEEKVTVEAAYAGERVPIYLFLPKNSPGPYQTVVYFPGAGSAFQRSSKDLSHYREFERHLSFIVKNGRAAVYPIYKGTFERREEAIAAYGNGAPTRQYTEYLSQLVKDVKRTVDYLETRKDINREKLAYFGYSWGGRLGPVVLATDGRFRASVFLVGGLRGNSRPEADEFNYVSGVKIPALMLNGKYDMTFAFDTQVKPMFELLGTPAGQKQLRVYEADHYVPRNEIIKETLAWLDRHLGPVK